MACNKEKTMHLDNSNTVNMVYKYSFSGIQGRNWTCSFWLEAGLMVLIKVPLILPWDSRAFRFVFLKWLFLLSILFNRAFRQNTLTVYLNCMARLSIRVLTKPGIFRILVSVACCIRCYMPVEKSNHWIGSFI